MINWNEKQHLCTVEVSMDLLSGKWKSLMLWRFNEGKKRYEELERIFFEEFNRKFWLKGEGIGPVFLVWTIIRR